MFRKLGLQLTAYNLLVLLALLVVIAAFAFFGSPRTATDAGTEAMWKAALSGSLPGEGHRRDHSGQGGLAVIKTEPGGGVADIETQLDLPIESYAQLTALVLQREAGSGQIPWDGREYAYLRFIESPERGAVVVLQETMPLGQSASAFLARVGPVLLVSMVLACAASFAITAHALVPIRRAWRRQVEFAADASHELRTPIAVIQANLEVVMDEPEQPVCEKEKWLRNVQLETDRMQKLVEDLLTISRTQAGQQTLEKAEFSLSQELQRAADPLVPYAQDRGVRLCSEIAPSMTWYGDAARLGQLVVILLDNAVKHTPAGGEVRLVAEMQGRAVRITVSDTGEGIAPAHQARIFDRFYRVDKARDRENGGSGLGLSIAKWIVEEHGGTISVSSEPGAGSAFRVTLPAG